jgi:hypothetical protein
MSPTDIAFILVVGILLVIVVVLMMLRRQFAERERVARERFPNARMIIRGANFFGQQSLGVMQGRGNGILVLTDTELYFERLLPRKEFSVPLAAIQSVETTNSFLGKTIFRPLLKVVFRNDAGQIDAMAWYVGDVEGTKRTIEAAINK